MLKKRKWIAFCVVMLLLMGSVMGCGGDKQENEGPENNSNGTASEAKDPDAVTIGTSTMGGTYYVVGAGLASTISKNTGVSANSQATSGSLQNVNMMDQGNAEFAVIASDSAYEIYKQIGDFAAKKYPVMMMSRGGVNNFHFVVPANSSIKTAEDLKGKKVAWQIPGSPVTEKAFRLLLEQYGLTEKDITSQAVTPISDATDRLKEGKIDAIWYPSIGSAAAFLELSTTADVKYLTIPAEITKKIQEEAPFYVETVIPANRYKGQSEDVVTFGFEANIVCHSDLSEDFVYRVTKALFENPDEMNNCHPSGSEFTDLDKAATQDVMPYHPGAIKYYQEKGIWTNPQVK